MLKIVTIVNAAGRVLAARGEIGEYIAAHTFAEVEVRPYKGFNAKRGTAQMVVWGVA